MLENKNIDRLFQEKLKDLEAVPNPQVWQNIEAKIKKKKRRIFPVWWLSSGIAAMLLLGLFLFPDTTNEVENIQQQKPIIILQQDQEKEEIIVSLEKGVQEIKSSSTKNKEIEKNLNTEKLKVNRSVSNNTYNIILDDQNKALKRVNDSFQEETMKGVSSDKKIVMEKILINEKEEEKLETKQGKEEKKKDFIAEVAKTKSEEENERTDQKWSVAPVFGIVKSNSFSQASAIDSNLKDNKVSGENTISYGVNVSYKLTKKWTVQSGLRVQKMEFTTQNVTVIPTSAINNNLQNVAFNTKTRNFLFASSLENADAFLLSNSYASSFEEGNLLQTVGYIELPVEIKYEVLSSKKIKTHLVTGVSSLFLNENSIIAKTDSFNQKVGEANNLNSVNFSGNLGVDFDVFLSKKIQLNINPMFKTQLNTYSKNSNGFKPYTIGVYGGLKYDF
jgi:hypothetical protein